MHKQSLSAALLSALVVCALSACGGSGDAVPLGSTTTAIPLTVTSGSSINLNVDQTVSYSVEHGSGTGGTNFTTYAIAANPPTGVINVGISGASWWVQGTGDGIAVVTITDAAGDQKTVNVTVGPTSTTNSSSSQ